MPDLAAAGVRLRPHEAVTIVREIALQVVRGQIAGVPSAHVVRLSSNGSVSIEGPVDAGGRPVVRVAQLLDSLLPDHEAGNEFRVPGGLKLVVARALGTLDLPPYGSLEAFVESLDRFAATGSRGGYRRRRTASAEAVAVRPSETGRSSAAGRRRAGTAVRGRARDRTPSAAASGESLTISDIRRARRATGIPLVKVAERSRIPLGLLRQLEWGYFFNWPKGRYGRSQLVRYARAAGLDEELVLSTITPFIDQAEPVVIEQAEPVASTRRSRWRRRVKRHPSPPRSSCGSLRSSICRSAPRRRCSCRSMRRRVITAAGAAVSWRRWRRPRP